MSDFETIDPNTDTSEQSIPLISSGLENMVSERILQIRQSRGCKDEEIKAVCSESWLRFLLRSPQDAWHILRCPLCRRDIHKLSSAMTILSDSVHDGSTDSPMKAWQFQPNGFRNIFFSSRNISNGVICAALFAVIVFSGGLGHLVGFGRGLKAGKQSAPQGIKIGPEKGTGLTPFTPMSPEGLVWGELPPPTSEDNIKRAILTLELYTAKPEQGPDIEPFRHLELLNYLVCMRKFVNDPVKRNQLEHQIRQVRDNLAPHTKQLAPLFMTLEGGQNHGENSK